MWKSITVVLHTKMNKMFLNLRNGRDGTMHQCIMVVILTIYGSVNLPLLPVLWYLSDHVFKFSKNVFMYRLILVRMSNIKLHVWRWRKTSKSWQNYKKANLGCGKLSDYLFNRELEIKLIRLLIKLFVNCAMLIWNIMEKCWQVK